MRWLVRYLLTQPEKHGLDTHPALWTGSCFADIIGARTLPGLQLQLGNALPRFRARSAYEAVGLPATAIAPATNAEIRVLGASGLTAAAAAAVAVDALLRGNQPAVASARRVAVRLATKAGISAEEVAWALGVSTRAVRRLRGQAVEEAAAATVRRRVALERFVDFQLRRNGRAVAG